MIIKISVPSRFRLKKTATFRTILMQNQGEIHYIGGADVLPAPLTLEEETRTLACLGTEEEKEAEEKEEKTPFGYAAIAIGVLLGVFGVVMLIDKL